jgi:hypothetical protein
MSVPELKKKTTTTSFTATRDDTTLQNDSESDLNPWITSFDEFPTIYLLLLLFLMNYSLYLFQTSMMKRTREDNQLMLPSLPSHQSY